MKNTSFQSLLAAALVTATVCAPAQSFLDVADASLDALREGREQNAAPANVRAIFAKAKAAADEDDKLNLCGFYTGMSDADAQTLAEYYGLKCGEWSIEGDPVYKITLSLKGVRRVTKGGNTFDELAQAVANRVGSLRQDWETKVYSLKTIDGISVTMSESSGFVMVDSGVQSKSDQIAREKRLRKEREAHTARLAAIIKNLVDDMVQIPGKKFKIGKTEVTQRQWNAIMGVNPSAFKSDDNPVENVSWEDCQAFLKKLNSLSAVKESRLVFRLPTEKEWEFACRAGATGDFCKLGDGTEITESTLGKVAWFDDNSDKQPHAVGQKTPNAFGVYDMIGNVHEWTQTADGEGRVFCGGGWNFSAEFCKASSKAKLLPSYRSDSFGFRLCADGNAD